MQGQDNDDDNDGNNNENKTLNQNISFHRQTKSAVNCQKIL